MNNTVWRSKLTLHPNCKECAAANHLAEEVAHDTTLSDSPTQKWPKTRDKRGDDTREIPDYIITPGTNDSDRVIDRLSTTRAPKKEPYRPVVKFRNIDKSVLEVIQNCDKAASGDSDEDEDEDEEDAVDPEDVEDAAFPASIPLPPAFNLSFVVDPDINITVPALLDLIAPESSIDTSTIPKQTASATPTAREDVQDVDWDW
ncbi:hypothetical protein B0H14DRAFT_3581422 [Mycena olivaceomarginata]|nr:hypothetical protein B0H14DRAFT_3581422 [Mycena olivaceomarginata]